MIPRQNYLDAIAPIIGKDLVKVITGMRRSGKSVLLGQIRQLIEHSYNPGPILSYNFESMEFDHLREASALRADILQRTGQNPDGKSPRKTPAGKVYIFLDEVQEVAQWEHLVASLRVELDCDIYVSGSNAKLLSGELATNLAGRYIEIEVLPFSFGEFRNGLASAGQDQGVEADFLRYVELGSMPNILQLDFDPTVTALYLRDIYNSVLLKDLVARHNIRDVDLLERILKHCLANIGQPFSATSVSKFLAHEGRKVAVETVLNYLGHAQQAFLIHQVPRTDLVGRRTLSVAGKYYANDHGIRSSLGFDNRKDIGQVLENIVYLELRRRGYQVTIGTARGKEVDFVATKGKDIAYFQVAYLLASPETSKREFSALAAIADNHPKTVLSLDPITAARDGIDHQNLAHWLLSQP